MNVSAEAIDPPKTKRGGWLVGIVLAALAVAALAVAGALYAFMSPGGMRPSYDATDYDRQLTDVASSAGVIIDALDRYSRDHAAFPDDPSDLAPYLSDAPTRRGQLAIHGWMYSKQGSGYSLWQKLGWDPSLRYAFDGAHGDWEFDPGDGRPTKTIRLRVPARGP